MAPAVQITAIICGTVIALAFALVLMAYIGNKIKKIRFLRRRFATRMLWLHDIDGRSKERIHILHRRKALAAFPIWSTNNGREHFIRS